MSGSAPSSPGFDTVIKGAERSEGLLTLWKRQDKVWVELAPADFGRAFYLSPKLSTGLGEGGFLGGLLASRWAQFGRPQWVEFRKVNQQIQLLAVNAGFVATPGSAQAEAVRSAFSPSLLSSGAVASAPHPQRGTVLVDLSGLLSSDLLGLGVQLQRAYRQSYSLDSRNSSVTQTQLTASGLMVEVQQHFNTSSISVPSGGTGPQPRVPSSLPDPRSLFITVQYTLSALPPQAMLPRVADPRVGFFTTTVSDFSQELTRTPRQRFINRWRLEKKDPQAALSEPVRPLVYWLDRSVPPAYRGAIRDGVLAWNAAFEAIGFKNAIEVRESTADQPRDIVGNGQAIIRWMTNSQASFGAIGPTHVDPRSGEILTADIALESLSSRAIRSAFTQLLSRERAPSDAPGTAITTGPSPSDSGLASTHDHTDACQHTQVAGEQLGYALAWLGAEAGEMPFPPGRGDVQTLVLAYLKDTTMHEVGHTLGLRHNFRASRWRSNEQLDQLALTQREGNSASVMDYAPVNLNLPGQPAGAPFQTTLGPYDFWAIEYGYKPLAGDASAQRKALLALAARSQEPAWQSALDYGTDEDSGNPQDPLSLTFDLGRDPVAFARRRYALARELLSRANVPVQGLPEAEDDGGLPRRRVVYAMREITRANGVLVRQVGGLVTRRDAPGAQRPLLDPLPAEQQRAALGLLIKDNLTPAAWALPAALQRQLAPNYFDRGEGILDASGAPMNADFSLAEQLMRLQRELLGHLMSDDLASRLLDNIDKTRDRDADPLTVRELHRRLRQAIWPARPTKLEDAAPWVRNLQRDYVNRLSVSVLRGSDRADVRAQLRQQARLLVRQLQARQGGDPDSTEQAHRRDCLETLQRALNASVVRATP